MSTAEDVLDRLLDQISERVRTRPAGSYTTKLLAGGVPAIGAKVREESDEVVRAADDYVAAKAAVAASSTPESQAAEAAAREHLIYEAGDVLYHLWVLLGSQGITLMEVRRELERREGTSGLEEKRRRNESA